ncbi:MAG TPA: MarR family transcriptional regulator [Thermoanaerobaculia bacterium]|jgi:DNA-binding MarR family transcriptional regulator
MNDSSCTLPSIVFRVLGAAHEVEARLEGALDGLGLSLAKFNVLSRLVETDEAMPLSQLADRCSCVRSNITQLVDRLEADRLVERLNDPHDRRSVRAGLTSAGRERHAEAVAVVQETEGRMFAGLDADDRETLCRLLGRLEAGA